MQKHWRFATSIIDGERYEINGLNIWDYNWQHTGEYINISDPIYGKAYTFPVYEIKSGEQAVIFAASEFSNLVWGIYVVE